MTQPVSAADEGTRSFDKLLAGLRDLLDTDPRAALEHAEKLLPSAPDPRVFRTAAEACRRLGMAADAEDAELAAIQAGFRSDVLKDAAVAQQEGRHHEARAMLERFLEKHPEDLLALTMAAEVDMQHWDLEQGEERLRIVLGRAPSFLRAIILLAKCLVLQARLKEGIALIEEVIRRKPNNRTSLEYVAELHAEANDHEAAAEVYQRVVALDPSNLPMWIIYAQQLRMLGRGDESIAAFRRALALDPNSGAAWWGLVNYFPSEVTQPDIAAIEQALALREGAAEDAGPLHIALGILAERRSDFAEAFGQISAGKQLRWTAHPYDSARASGDVDELIDALTPEHFATHASAGFPDDSPIFIVGMPRSGTTLLERILGCHSGIEPGGELPILPRLSERLRRGGDAGYAASITAMSADELRQLGACYVERSRDYRPLDRPRFADKLNSNWLNVGLIRLILPSAKIIDLRRDAFDCCWSNFKMLFADGAVASNDQRAIARYYRDYVRMIDAIDTASAGGILRVRYEHLVENVESETRRILEFLELKYEPACIDFHLSTAAVATPSSEQVRRPINRDSIGSAEPYRQWLGPMIEELGDLAS